MPGASAVVAAASWSTAFGPLMRGMVDQVAERRERSAISVADACTDRQGNSLGEAWMRCVVQGLIVQQTEAKANGSRSFFPVESDDLAKLRPGAHLETGSRVDELKQIMRNYSCEVADGGSQPVRSFTWTYRPSVDPCETFANSSAPAIPRFKYSSGFLPAGNDIHGALLSVAEAESECDADAECAGFTFSADQELLADSASKHNVLFKSSAEGLTPAAGWHTWRKIHRPDCSPAGRRKRLEPLSFHVNVLQESPPVYTVDDFVTDDECDFMLAYTLPRMTQSVVGGGGTSNWRRSYSVNMVPDFENEDNHVTRIARRKFAFAREVARYDVTEGVGQEPINAVYYKDEGDQYRPHCDGECYGRPYPLGSRVASSLAYCIIADQGGFTLFTRTHLKVVPRKRQERHHLNHDTVPLG